MDLHSEISYRLAKSFARADHSRMAVPTCVRGKEKAKKASWSVPRRETAPQGALSLPGLSPFFKITSSFLPIPFFFFFFYVKSKKGSADSQIPAAASRHVACFLSAMLPLQSTGYTLRNTGRHLRTQFASFSQHFCFYMSAV